MALPEKKLIGDLSEKKRHQRKKWVINCDVEEEQVTDNDAVGRDRK